MEKESEANRIVEDAKAQADEIKKKGQEKGEEVYKKTYEQAVAKAKQRSLEFKEHAKEDAQHDAKIFLQQAEEKIKTIRTKAEKKIDKAVDAILNEILT
jgi:V/A-type H+-transporting ATPase subunit G/H